MQSIIAALSSTARNRRVLESAVAAGYGTIYKFKRAFTTEDGKTFTRREMARAFVIPSRRVIGVNVGFIEARFTADPFSGFDIKQQKFLHEAFHVVDEQQGYSKSAAFQEAYKSTLIGVDLRACGRVRTRFLGQSEQGSDNDAWKAMRMSIQSISDSRLVIGTISAHNDYLLR